MNPLAAPLSRPGYRWEYRPGCLCPNCPWGERCIGRTWPHWIEVKDKGTNS